MKVKSKDFIVKEGNMASLLQPNTPVQANQSIEVSFKESSPKSTKTPTPKVKAAQHSPSNQKVNEDSRYIDITGVLPSKCAVYKEGSVAIRPFTAFEVQKIHRAIVEKSLRHEVDAIGACLSMSAYDLTLGDFHWILYWEKINSYKRTPMTFSWKCTDIDHITKVGTGVLADSTLNNVHTLTNSDLQEQPLNEGAADAFAKEFFSNYGLYLDLPRMSDIIEDEEDTDTDSDNAWFSKYASHINRLHYGATLKTRRQYFKGWLNDHSDPDIIEELEHWIKLVEHDVVETIPTVCKECGAKGRVTMSISPLNFLPGYNS